MTVTDLIPRTRNRETAVTRAPELSPESRDPFIVAKDRGTGLMLVRDEQDPPRFYLRRNGRRELISIGDTEGALRQFSREARRLKSLRSRRPALVGGNVIQFPYRPEKELEGVRSCRS